MADTLEIGSWPSSFAKAMADWLEIHYGAEVGDGKIWSRVYDYR